MLTLWFVLRLFFLCGFSVGAIGALVYVLQQTLMGPSSWSSFVVAVLVGPLLNGVFTALVGAIGYPFYSLLVKRGRFQLETSP
jgi:uncharacterized membrane protein YjjB (DUF3815 family)